jgi:hypothetical protein
VTRGDVGLDRDDLAVVGAGVVTLAAAWLPWYEGAGGLISLRGWGMGIASVVAIVASLYAAGRVAYLRGRPQKPGVPVTPQLETFGAALLSLLLLVYRVLDAPDVVGARRSYGIAIALLAVLVQVVCAGRKLGRTGVRAP